MRFAGAKSWLSSFLLNVSLGSSCHYVNVLSQVAALVIASSFPAKSQHLRKF
jgi:hypothetical protein